MAFNSEDNFLLCKVESIAIGLFMSDVCSSSVLHGMKVEENACRAG